MPQIWLSKETGCGTCYVCRCGRCMEPEGVVKVVEVKCKGGNCNGMTHGPACPLETPPAKPPRVPSDVGVVPGWDEPSATEAGAGTKAIAPGWL